MENTNCIDEEGLVINGELAYFKGIPFCGMARKEWTFLYRPGFNEWHSYTAFTPYNNGIKHGICKAYYDTSQPRFQFKYNNGHREGAYLSWHKNGNLNQKGFYKKGEKMGVWKTWFIDEGLEIEEKFENDKKIGEKTWYENCQLKSKKSDNGLFENDEIKIFERRWFENGQLKYEKKLLKKSNSIIRLEWHKNGQLTKKELSKGHEANYLFERLFYDNNIVESERNYKIKFKYKKHIVIGEKEPREFKTEYRVNHGSHTYWFKDGKICYKKRYKEDKEEGRQLSWSQNGQLIEDIEFLNGKKNGISKSWDFKGNLINIKVFKRGRIVKQKYFFKNYVQIIKMRVENGRLKQEVEYQKNNGQLLPKSEWPNQEQSKSKMKNSHKGLSPRFNDKYYNDQLDMDQQGSEFWDNV